MKILLHQPENIAHAERYLSIHQMCLERLGIEVFTNTEIWNFGTLARLQSIARALGADVIHSLTIDGGKISLLADALMRSRGIPVIGTFHNFPRLSNPSASSFLEYLLVRGVLKHVVLPCGFRKILPLRWRSKSEVSCVFEPIESEKYTKTSTTRQNYILYAGTVTREKGAVEFARFASKIFGRIGFKSIIAGYCADNNLAHELENLAESSEGALILQMQFQSEEVLLRLIREASLLWSAYSHKRSSGIAYRAIELGIPLLANHDSVVGVLIEKYNIGWLLVEGSLACEETLLSHLQSSDSNRDATGFELLRDLLDAKKYAKSLIQLYKYHSDAQSKGFSSY